MASRTEVASNEGKKRDAVIKAALAILSARKNLARIEAKCSASIANAKKYGPEVAALHKSIASSTEILIKHGLDPKRTLKDAEKALKAKRVHWSDGDRGGPGVYGVGARPKFWKE